MSDILILILDPELPHEALTRSPVGQPTYSMNACNLELRLKLRASIRRQTLLAQIHRRALLLLASLVENGSNVRTYVSWISELELEFRRTYRPTRPSDPA